MYVRERGELSSDQTCKMPKLYRQYLQAWLGTPSSKTELGTLSVITLRHVKAIIHNGDTALSSFSLKKK